MNEFPNAVRRALNKEYKINIEDFISQANKIVNKEAGLFIGFSLVFFLISGAAEGIPLVGSLLDHTLGTCLTVGFYFAAAIVQEDRVLRFEDFFQGFKDYIPLCIIGGAHFLLSLLINIPFGGLGIELGSNLGYSIPSLSGTSTFGLLLLIPYIYLMVAWSFAPLFVIFYKMDAWPAMEASRQLINKNWGGFFLLYFVAVLFFLLGLLILCVGILFTFPVCMVTTFIAFKSIVGLGDEEDHDLMDHLLI